MTKRMLAVGLLTLLLLAGCAREGFDGALALRGTAPESPSSSTPSEEPSAPPEDVSFQLEDGEIQQDGIFILYAQPKGDDDRAAAGEAISMRIAELMTRLSGAFDMSAAGASLEVTDSVSRNDGSRFSAYYDGLYRTTANPDGTPFAFGLAFNARTGEQLPLDAVTTPNALAAFLTDGQSCELLTDDETLRESQKQHLSGLSLSALSERIVAAAPQQTLEQILDLSFYLEGNRLVIILPLSNELGSVVKVMTPGSSS